MMSRERSISHEKVSSLQGGLNLSIHFSTELSKLPLSINELIVELFLIWMDLREAWVKRILWLKVFQ
jgi:hypothetical protein